MNKDYVRSKLLELNSNPRLKGFEYVIDIISMIDNSQYQNASWMVLYAEIANIYNTKPANVDKAIRIFFNNCRNNLQDYDKIDKYFGYNYCENSSTLIHFYNILKAEESRIALVESFDIDVVRNIIYKNYEKLLEDVLDYINHHSA